MADLIFDEFKRQLTSEAFDWESDEIRIMLLTGSYAPVATQVNYGAIKANEVSGSGYTAGGKALASKTASVVSNVLTLTCDNVVWSSSTLSNVKYAVIFKNSNPGGAVSDASPVLLCYDFGTPKSSSNDNFTFVVNAAGLVTISG